MTALLAPELTGFVTVPHVDLLQELGYALPSREEVLALRTALRRAEGTVVEVAPVAYFVALDSSWDEDEGYSSWPNGVAQEKFTDGTMGELILDLAQRGVQEPVGVAFLPGSSLLTDGFQFTQMNGHHRLFASLFLGLPILPVFVQRQAYGYCPDFDSTGEEDYSSDEFNELLQEEVLTAPSRSEYQTIYQRLDELAVFLQKLVASDAFGKDF